MQPKPKINIIDFSEELYAIREEFGEYYYKNDKATQKAAKIWGSKTNGISSVFKDLTKETIALCGKCQAKVTFTHTSKDYWLIGINAMTSHSGRGYAPNVWSCIGYQTYHDARLAGVLRLIDFFTMASKRSDEPAQKDIQKMLEVLEAEKTPQLNLF